MNLRNIDVGTERANLEILYREFESEMHEVTKKEMIVEIEKRIKNIYLKGKEDKTDS